MLTIQAHRGPDGEGLVQIGPVVLGHRRLAIIDLSDGGRQPKSNETKTVWVTFNGEIYNYLDLRRELIQSGHVFDSSSDTEVLLHGYEEWGIDGLVRRLRGMFAFALYDAEAERRAGAEFLFIARDRIGIKPLYYYLDVGRSLSFASEVRALVASSAISNIDVSAITSFLCFGSVPYPRTYQKHVRCVEPGHFLAVGRKGVRIQKYWELSYDHGAEPSDVSGLLADAVNRHLLADVPVGVFLSGGLDSAAIAGLAARSRTAPLSTLTISFSEDDFNEAEEARAFATEIGSDHHEIHVSAADFTAEIPRFLEALDQPTADGVNTYFVSRAAHRMGLKVVLSGLGGDEVFFGYPHYRALVSGTGALGGYLQCPPAVRAVMGAGATLYGRIGGRDRWERFEYCRGRNFHEGFYLLIRGFFPPRQVAELTGTSMSEVNSAVESTFESVRTARHQGISNSDHFNYFEVRRYLHDQLLRDSDVFSMAHSLELRVPLVDHVVLETLCKMRPTDKVSSAVNKPKLASALPNGILHAAARRPKRGFTFPFAKWMLAKADELEDRALQGQMLDGKAVRNCWARFRAGRVHWSRAWSTVVVNCIA